MPMRVDCKHFESRTYASGETVRKCRLDLAPEAPWRCPDDCPRYERRRADVGWNYGSLGHAVASQPEEPPELGDDVAALLDAAEDIVNAAGADMVAEEERRRQRKLFRKRGKGKGRGNRRR